jgi:endoglucanase
MTAGGRRVAVGVVIGVLGAVLLALVGAAVFSAVRPDARPPDPRPVGPLDGARFYVDPDSSASRAARDDPSVAPIARRPTAIWLTPEAHDADAVGAYVGGIVDAARGDGTWPVLVVYGVPHRDCQARQSAGGAVDDAAYRTWVAAIARGLAPHTVVVLEPDALALTGTCADGAARVAELRSAVDLLSPTGALVYLDAGHSGWIAPSTMAGLLRDAGVTRIRGFASNVSNFETTAAERRYDAWVSAALGGAHYVIDTSRNGSGPAADRAWCNPPGRLLGKPPRVVDDGTALDATLWIKNPGESDGACNGGPAAGRWWPEGARALVGGGG